MVMVVEFLIFLRRLALGSYVQVIGSSKKKEKLFIEFQPIVSKCCASEVQCLAVLTSAP